MKRHGACSVPGPLTPETVFTLLKRPSISQYHSTSSSKPSQIHPPLGQRIKLTARIGAGTGLFTRALLADKNDETKIASLQAVEPSAGMRELFKQRVSHESVTISDGTFDNVPTVENGWADLVIVAQVCHLLHRTVNKYASCSSGFSLVSRLRKSVRRVRPNPKTDWNACFYLELGGQVTRYLPVMILS